ncbi:MAG: TIGR03067 domain-containing protein [Planctomycetales bacterium]|nr:TIGR03067 domain-containing protein [Planctomycetales bacterium]
MQRRQLVPVYVGLLAAIALLSVHALSEAKEMSDPKLAGVWKVAELTIDGNRLPAKDLVKAKIEIDVARFTNYEAPHGKETTAVISGGKQGDLSIMNLKIAEGKFKGTTLFGIYKFDGDDLLICQSDMRSESAPTAFESKKGNYHALMRLTRVSE